MIRGRQARQDLRSPAFPGDFQFNGIHNAEPDNLALIPVQSVEHTSKDTLLIASARGHRILNAGDIGPLSETSAGCLWTRYQPALFQR